MRGENWSRAVLCKQTQSETQRLQSSHLFRVFSSGGGHPWGCEHVHTCLSIYYRPAFSFTSHRSNRVTVPLSANRWQHAIIQPQRIFARVGLVFFWPGGSISTSFHIFRTTGQQYLTLIVIWRDKTRTGFELLRVVTCISFTPCWWGWYKRVFYLYTLHTPSWFS